MKAMDIACKCEAETAFSLDTVKLACKLLVHTHAFNKVLEFVLGGQTHSQQEKLFAVLDESYTSLRQAIADWRCSKPSNCSGSIEATDFQTTLSHIKRAGGVGIIPLRFLENFLQKEKPSSGGVLAMAGHSRPRLHFLFEWARSAWDPQDRFLLLGILFSPSLLVHRLPDISNDLTSYSNVLQSLSDLNSLEQFDRPLQHQLAETLLNLELPRTPRSCVAWVEALQLCLATEDHPQGQEQQKTLLQDGDLVERATHQLMKSVYWACGRTGWAGFINQAFLFFNQIQTRGFCSQSSDLQELAVFAKGRVADEVQAHTQANVLLSQMHISSKD